MLLSIAIQLEIYNSSQEFVAYDWASKSSVEFGTECFAANYRKCPTNIIILLLRVANSRNLRLIGISWKEQMVLQVA